MCAVLNNGPVETQQPLFCLQCSKLKGLNRFETTDYEGSFCGVSRAREREEGGNIARVGSLQRIDIAQTNVACALQILGTPTEDKPFMPLGKHIRHQARVAAVAVREGMDQNQPMMETDCKFVGRIGSVFQPIACIAQQGGEAFADFVVRDANVFLGGAIRPCPLPGLIEHAQMEISNVRLDKRITAAKTVGCERPRIRFENILSFPLVQLFLGRKIGNEICLLVGRQRRIALCLREEIHRTPRFPSIRLVSASTASSTRPTA